MGRCDYYAEGYGLTQQEAFIDACNRKREEYGHQDGYTGTILDDTGEENMKVKCIRKPKPAKRCEVKWEPQKGTRKWVTKYLAQDFHGKTMVVADSKAEVLKGARKKALTSGERLYIRIVKRLENGNQEIGVVEPKKQTLGIWGFGGIARC
jgi:hypothetical protein